MGCPRACSMRRYLLAFLIHAALMLQISLQTYIPIMWGTMTDDSLDSEARSLINASIFVGNAIGAFSGVYFSVLRIGKLYFFTFTAFMSCAIYSLELPVLLIFYPKTAIVSTFTIGFYNALFCSAIERILPYWTPEKESTLMTSIFRSAGATGRFLGVCCGGFLSQSTSWMHPIVIYGNCLLFATIILFFMATDTPEHHTHLSKAEKKFILANRRIGSPKYSIHENIVKRILHLPWKAVLTSSPLWATVFIRVTRGLSLQVLMHLCVKFMNFKSGIFEHEFDEIEFMQYGVWILAMVLAACASDMLRNHGFSTDKVRKAVYTAGQVVEILGFMMIMHAQNAGLTIFACVCISAGLGLLDTTSSVVRMDISLRLLPFTCTISLLVASAVSCGFIYLVEILTHISDSPHTWRTLLSAVIAFKFFIWIFVMLFHSSEVEDWDDVDLVDKTNTEKLN